MPESISCVVVDESIAIKPTKSLPRPELQQFPKAPIGRKPSNRQSVGLEVSTYEVQISSLTPILTLRAGLKFEMIRPPVGLEVSTYEFQISSLTPILTLRARQSTRIGEFQISSLTPECICPWSLRQETG